MNNYVDERKIDANEILIRPIVTVAKYFSDRGICRLSCPVEKRERMCTEAENLLQC
jgi:hypothetical protein